MSDPRGLIPLRPLSLGDILGGAFRLVIRNPRTTLGTALLVYLGAFVVGAAVVVALLVVGVGLFASASTSGRLALVPVAIVAGGLLFVLAFAVSFALQAILPAVYILATSHQVVGEKMRLGGLLAQARGRIGVLVGWTLLLAAAGFVGVVVIGGLAALFTGLGGRAGAAIGALLVVLGLVAFVVAAVWIGTKTVFVPSILLLERLTLGQAIARSWRLTRQSFWRVFGIIALVAIIVSTAANVVSAPISILTQFVIGPSMQPTVSSNGTLVGPDFGSFFDASRIVPFVLLALVSNLLTLLITAIGSIVQSATVALLYLDLRIRRERLDLELFRYVQLRDSGVMPLPDPYRPPHPQTEK